MTNWTSITIACAAVLISIVALIVNWRHSENLFRRKEYPAVAWYLPKVSKVGINTVLTMSICNNGPRDIGSIYLSAFICRGCTVRAWCKSERIERISIGEELVFTLTKEFETDIKERFSEIMYENAWRFRGRPRRYKIIFKIEYLPFIADAKHYIGREYYLLKPILGRGELESWELIQIPNWKGWLPWR